MSSQVVVVGAGAAGIIAAWRAATLGAQVTLIEKTPRVGTKILISGGGKCNITHDCSVQELLQAFRPNEARFLKPSCYKFKSNHILDMLTSCGLEVMTRADGRVFPVHQTAKDVVRILRSYLDDAGVRVRLDTACSGIEVSDGQVTGVRIGERVLESQRVVVCVGGSSYPNSGTTGDGWKWGRELGHSIIKPIAALAPIYMTMSQPMVARSGVALRDCVLKARQSGKEVMRWRGDLLFTHHGISGPTALGVSREVTEALLLGSVSLEVDVLPGLDHEKLKNDLIDLSQRSPRLLISSVIGQWLPESLVADLLETAQVAGETPLVRLDKGARNRVIQTLKGWNLGDVRTVPLEKGEVVAGGVSLDEVDPGSMESRLVKRLYLCGEVLDIAGPVGGYNLQAAFSMGYAAGSAASL